MAAPNGLKSSGSSSGSTARAPGAVNDLASAITVAPSGALLLRDSSGASQDGEPGFDFGSRFCAGGADFATSAATASNAGKAPPITVRLGSAGFRSGGVEFGIRFGLSNAAITRAMFSGRSAGSGCNIQVNNGTSPASTPVRSGTDDLLPTASTIDAPICNTSPRLAPAVTKASE